MAAEDDGDWFQRNVERRFPSGSRNPNSAAARAARVRGPRLYSVKSVANALGVTGRQVARWIHEGKVQATRVGARGHFRIPEVEFNRIAMTTGAWAKSLGDKPEDSGPAAKIEVG